jgi:uncharacterized protein (TIGR02118 family)
MVKLVFCCRRLSQLSRQEFQRYWHDTHGPLVRRHADALRIRRYVQSHTLDHAINAALAGARGAPEEFDGIAEVWWDSLDDVLAATTTPEGRAAGQTLYEDERQFIDHARSPLWLSEEHPIVES